MLCSCPDLAVAERLARLLVEQKRAACVSIGPPVRSVYRWQGEVETADECLLLIKTSRLAYPELEALLASEHPYEVPEIVALSVSDGLPAYLNWLDENSLCGSTIKA